MPSLLGTSVAANYGKMTAQTTSGVGAIYSNFGTRQLRFVKIVATSDGSTAVNFSTNSTSALSNFAVAVRALQNVAELYFVSAPNSTGFVVAVAEDTINDIDSGNGGQAGEAGVYGYGVLEAAVVAALKANSVGSGSTATASAFSVVAA